MKEKRKSPFLHIYDGAFRRAIRRKFTGPRRLIAVVKRRGYMVAKEAHDEVLAQKANGMRVLAPLILGGGRGQWAAIVDLWEEARRQGGQEPRELRIYADGSVLAVGDDSEVQKSTAFQDAPTRPTPHARLGE